MKNKCVKEKVERELEQLVDTIIEIVPSVKEVRVFGSYNTRHWNPQSDIDVFVESDNEFYSTFIPPLFSIGQRDEIRERLIRRMSEENWNYDFNVHWFSSGDVKRLSMRNQGRGSLGRNMKSGRLLYPKPEFVCEKIYLELEKRMPKQALLYE